MKKAIICILLLISLATYAYADVGQVGVYIQERPVDETMENESEEVVSQITGHVVQSQPQEEKKVPMADFFVKVFKKVRSWFW